VSSVNISVETHNRSFQVSVSAPNALQFDPVSPGELIDEAVARIKAALGSEEVS
jgi:hypothetical protein